MLGRDRAEPHRVGLGGFLQRGPPATDTEENMVLRFVGAAAVAAALTACSGGAAAPVGAPALPNSMETSAIDRANVLSDDGDVRNVKHCGYAPTGSSRLYVANQEGNDILSFQPPAYSTATIVQKNVDEPDAVAFDKKKDMFVSQVGSPFEVEEFAPPYTGSPIATTTVSVAGTLQGIALDNGDRLYIAEPLAGKVLVLDPPYTESTPSQTISTGLSDPTAVAFDSYCGLWVTNNANASSGGYVARFKPPYKSAPSVLIKNLTAPAAIAFDKHNDIFINTSAAGSGPQYVQEFAPPYKSGPKVTITNGITYSPLGVAVDSSGNLFVSLYFADKAVEYAPPYSAPPTRTITS
jgi:hypothetical protein